MTETQQRVPLLHINGERLQMRGGAQWHVTCSKTELCDARLEHGLCCGHSPDGEKIGFGEESQAEACTFRPVGEQQPLVVAVHQSESSRYGAGANCSAPEEDMRHGKEGGMIRSANERTF